MSHVAIITGISGREFYLTPEGKASETAKNARTFRSDRAAITAAQHHIDTVAREFGPAVARHMSFRIEAKGDQQ